MQFGRVKVINFPLFLAIKKLLHLKKKFKRYNIVGKEMKTYNP